MSTLFTQHTPHVSVFLVRVLLFCFVTLTAVTGPWWLSFGVAIIHILFFKMYEVVFAGLVLDTLFAGEGFSFFAGDFLFTSILLCLISFSLLFLQRFRSIGSH